MIPSVGRIVHYRLSESDVGMAKYRPAPGAFYNTPREGDVLPMLICRVWADEPTETSLVNGQVFVDGNFSIWATSRAQGDQPGQWSDPRA